MAAVRSKRLAGPTQVGTTATTLYTCPPGETALVKTVSLVNAGALARDALLGINGSGTANRIVWLTLPATQGVNLDGLFVVLQPGDTIVAQGPGGNVTFTLYGAELEGVAD